MRMSTGYNIASCLNDQYDICLPHEIGSAHVKFDVWIKRRTLLFGSTQIGINFGTWKFRRLNRALYIYRTSMLSFGGFLQEPKPILRYVLDECLNAWLEEEWKNLELYHIKTTTKLKFLSA